ncbi:hypothetical protein AMJ80_03675 [bacterium SM23_31]|nr:MAG: hypothetical protein AMJ80_03675 [bacterium SM23_31]
MYSKKILISCICVVGLFAALHVSPAAAQENVIENPFTPLFRFGVENLPDEYLLARPEESLIASDTSGNIYLFDEYCVKVYDQDGKPKAIFGGLGEGPGYFSSSSLWPNAFIFVSERGFLTIGGSSYANVFYPDHTFLKRYYFRSNMAPWQSFFSETGYKRETEHCVYVIDENRRIFRLIASKTDEVLPEDPKDLLVYQNGDKNTLIAEYDHVTMSGMGEFGPLFFSVLPGERLIYTHVSFDTRLEGDKGIYTLNIVDLNTWDKSEISLPFTPRMFNEKQLRPAEEFKYYTPFVFLMNDGDFVFLWNYIQDERKITVDVIDTKEKRHTCTMILTEETRATVADFEAWVFVNGIAYFLIVPMDEFAYVQVCKIDPAGYGK